jgi:hypothetical protein
LELSEALQVSREVAEILERLGVPYLLGGSLASSLHGIPRSTQDADLVAALEERHVGPLVEALAGAFYVDEERAFEAVRHRASFNLIHLKTMLKVDLFVLRDEPFSHQEMARRQIYELVPGGATVPVATAEDTILQKLRWYRLGGEVSERQWNDLLGVFKVQKGRLDLDYLSAGASHLEVSDLLGRALAQSGVPKTDDDAGNGNSQAEG